MTSPTQPSVAILILNWNGRPLLADCLPPLLAQTYPHVELVVVDNGSSDDSVPFVKSNFPRVRLIELGQNLGFSGGYNAAFPRVDADYFILLNNDVVAEPTLVESLLRPFQTAPDVGVVGGKLLFPDGTIQHLGAALTRPLAFSIHHRYGEPDAPGPDAPREVDYVTGAAMAFPRALWQAIGGFDPRFSPYYYEEVDFCYRARAAGRRVVVVGDRLGIHDEGASMPAERQHAYQRNRLRFVLKTAGVDAFLDDFVPAETAYLESLDAPQALGVLRAVYLALDPTVQRELSGDPRLPAVRRALQQLAGVASERMTALAAAIPPLRPYDFEHGHPAVAAVRRWWGSVAARWLVGDLLTQQQAINARLREHIAALEAFIAAQQEAARLQQEATPEPPEPGDSREPQ